MNPEFINLKETAEEAEFEEVNPQSNKLQNAGLSGAHTVPAFDESQYDANRGGGMANAVEGVDYRVSTATELPRIRMEDYPDKYHSRGKSTTPREVPKDYEAARRRAIKAKRKARKQLRK